MRDLLLALVVTIAAADPPRDELFSRALKVEKDGAVIAHLWPACTHVETDGVIEERANFSQIRRGELLGVVTFEREWRDYRGQRVPPGTYELRYAVQPLLKDHAGTTRWRDFAILTGSSTSSHPFVMAIVPADEAHAHLTLPNLRLGVLLEGTGELGF